MNPEAPSSSSEAVGSVNSMDIALLAAAAPIFWLPPISPSGTLSLLSRSLTYVQHMREFRGNQRLIEDLLCPSRGKIEGCWVQHQWHLQTYRY